MTRSGSSLQPQAAAEAARGGQCEVMSGAQMEVERAAARTSIGIDLRRETGGRDDMREHEHDG